MRRLEIVKLKPFLNIHKKDDFPHTFIHYTSTHEILTLYIYPKPEKGTPFGRDLPV